MAEEELVIVTRRVEQGLTLVAGSKQDRCSECGEPVWVSPSSVRVMEDNPGSRILCLQCALPTPEDAVVLPLDDNQVAEIEAAVRREKAKRIAAFARRWADD